MAENETSVKKQWGIVLIVLPLVVWLITAFANGFDFSEPWLGSAGTDLFLGIVGLIVIVIGIFLVATSKRVNKHFVEFLILHFFL